MGLLMRFIPICMASLLLMPFSVAAATDIQEIKYGNGQKAWLVEDHNLPVVTVKIELAGSGSAYDPQGKEGLAYFATHMLDEGAGDMDSLAFNHALEEHAIRFSANATDDSVSVSLQTLSEFKQKSFELLALALNKPRFDNDAVERIRGSIMTTLRQYAENPSYIASLQWKKNAFAGHPYHNPKIGTLESVAAIKREDIENFKNSHLACSRKIVAVAGDITAGEVKSLLTALFPASECKLNDPVIADIKPAEGGAPIIVSKNVPQTVIHASLPAVMRSDPRYYAMVILNNILGGNTMISRMGKEIRDKRGLAYYANSSIGELQHTSYLAMDFATRSQQAETAVGVFLEELGKIRDNGVTEAELAETKSYITGSFPLGLDSQNSLAEYLVSIQHYNLGIDYLAKRNSLVNSVTISQVNDLAKTIFSHKPLIVMVGSPEEASPK